MTNAALSPPAVPLRDAIEAGTARCAVVGLGFIGTTLAQALAHAGFSVSGVDRSPAAADRARRQLADDGLADAARRLGTDPAVLDDARVVVVAVRALPRPDGTFDLGPLRDAARSIREAGAAELVVVSSTAPPGTTRAFAEWLGGSTPIAHAPERLAVGDDWRFLKRTAHLVGGVTPEAGRLGAALFAHLCADVVAVSAPEVSELSKLLENAFLSVGIALAGDVAAVAHGLGISAHEVSAAAATKGGGYFPFYPGPGVGGHCLPNDLAMLDASARAVGAQAPVVAGARAAIGRQPAATVDRLAEVLDGVGKGLRGARVLLVGVGFKPGCADTTATPAGPVADALAERGADVAYLDGLVSQWRLPRVAASDLAAERFDAAVVVSGDGAVSDADLLATGAVVLRAGDRARAERPADGVHLL